MDLYGSERCSKVVKVSKSFVQKKSVEILRTSTTRLGRATVASPPLEIETKTVEKEGSKNGLYEPGAPAGRGDLRIGLGRAEEVLVRQREVREVEAGEDLAVVLPLAPAGEEAAVGPGRQVEERDGARGRGAAERLGVVRVRGEARRPAEDVPVRRRACGRRLPVVPPLAARRVHGGRHARWGLGDRSPLAPPRGLGLGRK
jgi:hypothetical protein